MDFWGGREWGGGIDFGCVLCREGGGWGGVEVGGGGG